MSKCSKSFLWMYWLNDVDSTWKFRFYICQNESLALISKWRVDLILAKTGGWRPSCLFWFATRGPRMCIYNVKTVLERRVKLMIWTWNVFHSTIASNKYVYGYLGKNLDSKCNFISDFSTAEESIDGLVDFYLKHVMEIQVLYLSEWISRDGDGLPLWFAMPKIQFPVLVPGEE